MTDADETARQLARKTRELEILGAISEQINATLDLDRVFDLVLSTLDAVFAFKHSMILVPDDAGAVLRVAASRGYPASGVGATVEIGKGVIGVVARKRRVMRMVSLGTQRMYVASARNAGEAPAGEVPLPGLPDARSQVAIPLVAKDRLVGVYAVESPEHSAFDALDERFLAIVGSHIATAIDNASAYHAQVRLSDAYSRFVPREFLAFLEKGSILDVRLGDQVQRDMTILFMDIRSFTALSERMTPKENFDFINDFLTLVAPMVRDHGGFIDKYIGDAIMALFPRAPDDALRAAAAMQRRVRERRAGGGPTLSIGIGVHTGTLMLGIVGFADRMEGTVIADSVNLASRLEGLTKDFRAGVIASEAALRRLEKPDAFHTRRLGVAQVKGKSEAVPIYEAFDHEDDAAIARKTATRPRFEAGVAAVASDRAAAARCFEEVLAADPDDAAAQAWLARART